MIVQSIRYLALEPRVRPLVDALDVLLELYLGQTGKRFASMIHECDGKRKEKEKWLCGREYFLGCIPDGLELGLGDLVVLYRIVYGHDKVSEFGELAFQSEPHSSSTDYDDHCNDAGDDFWIEVLFNHGVRC